MGPAWQAHLFELLNHVLLLSPKAIQLGSELSQVLGLLLLLLSKLALRLLLGFERLSPLVLLLLPHLILLLLPVHLQVNQS